MKKKEEKKSKEQGIHRRQLKEKRLNISIITCGEPCQISRYVLGSYHEVDSRFGSTAVIEIYLDKRSQANIIPTYLISKNTLSISLCRKRRRECAFLVPKTEIERPQKLPD